MKFVFRLTVVCSALLLLAGTASADWSENFDSYTVGDGLHGIGGWAGWDNDPSCDAYVTDAQAYSAPNAVAIIETSDIVQMFDEDTGEWEMTGWSWVPSTATGQQYFIMLNIYDPDSALHDWSVQICFDSDADVVEETYSGSTTAILTDQWVELKIEIFLDLNSYNVYYNDSFLASHEWFSSGVPEIAALDLFSDGASPIYWDDLDLVMTSSYLQQSTWGHIKTIMQ